MTWRRALLVVASAALGLLLIGLLIKSSKIDPRVTLQQLQSVSRLAFIKLVLLTGLHVFLSNLKWRSIDAAVRHESDSVPSRTTSFALTSAGVAFGQVLPIQLSMSAARTLGTYFHGRALKRGTAGTLFEQGFDLLIVAFLSIASVVAWFYNGGAMMWTACAAAATTAAMLAVEPSMRLFRWFATYTAMKTTSDNGILRRFAGLQNSVFLNARLGRRLMMLSAARFVIQVLMAGQAAEAIGTHVPLWQFAAAMPFVIIACILAVTPAGLGVNELSYATALSLFGTPAAVGAQWAFANRFLVAAACFFVAGCGVTVLCVERLVWPSPRRAMQE
jgi:uncharacterized membrane protein YbhN (UPF0104 family)